MKTREQRATQQLGRLLREIGKSEAAGNSVLRLLGDSPLLAAPELKFLNERMIPEERAHERMCLDWSAKYTDYRGHHGPFGSLINRDVMLAAKVSGRFQLAHILAVVHWNEKSVVQRYPWWIEVFDRLERGLADDFRQVVEDETEHAAWGRRVIRRLELEDPATFKMFEVAYEAVRRVYGSVVHSTHYPVWRELAAVAGLAGAK